jgi:hypothetical protein
MSGWHMQNQGMHTGKSTDALDTLVAMVQIEEDYVKVMCRWQCCVTELTVAN